jgi:hypothetical protein
MIIRFHTGDKVKIIDEVSQYFGKTGIVTNVRSVPVRMRLEYHLLVKLDGTNTMEVFAPKQLKTIN